MAKILSGKKEFILTSFQNEAELEKVVVKNYLKIFGENSFYFDIKKGIRHKKGGLLTIPDGYLIKFEPKPTLVIVENELSTHEAVNHIGIQLMKFKSALSTEASKYSVKKFLTQYLKDNPNKEKKLKTLLSNTSNKDLSTLFDEIILDKKIEYAVLIDETTKELEMVLNQFDPEIIVIKKFQNKNKVIYHIDVESSTRKTIPSIKKFSKKSKKKEMRKPSEMDTIVCPAQQDGFNKVFLQEHRWFQIRINSSKIPKIKYLAMYESAPVSAINYIGRVADIKPYKKTGKYEIILRGPAQKLKTPIKLSSDNPNLAPQGPKYSSKSLFNDAKILEDIFPR